MNCEIWDKSKLINPFTNKPIKEDSNIYKMYQKMCSNDNGKENCLLFKNNREINPLTGRKLIRESTVAQLIDRICGYEEVKMNKIPLSRTPLQAMTPIHMSPFIPKQLPFKEHQQKVIDYIKHPTEEMNGLLIFHGIGTGKTLLSLGIAQVYSDTHKIYFISPSSLVQNFKKEVDKFGIEFRDNVVFTTHTKFTNKIKQDGPAFAKNSIIIIDEAHKYAQAIIGSNTSLLMTATAIAAKVFLLTATPISNYPIEFATLYCMITKNEDYTAIIQDEFKRLLLENKQKELFKLLKNKISFFNNTDVTDFPKVKFHKVELEMTPVYYKMYMDVENQTIVDMEESIFREGSDLTVFYNGIRRGVNNLSATISSYKILWASTKIQKDFAKNKKVLFYSNWLGSGSELLKKQLDIMGIRYVSLNGDMTLQNRRKNVELYNKGLVRVLLISSSGAEGLDLKETRSVIILEPHWNNERIKQVMGRAIRYKSHENLPPKERKVDVFLCVLQKPTSSKDHLPSADDYLLKLAERKEKIIEKFYKVLEKASI